MSRRTRTRTEKIEVRMTPEEKAFIQKAAEKKDLTNSDFVRFVAVEMAKAIVSNATPEEQYYAVLMGAGRISPEVTFYAASADFSPSPSPEPPGKENEG